MLFEASSYPRSPAAVYAASGLSCHSRPNPAAGRWIKITVHLDLTDLEFQAELVYLSVVHPFTLQNPGLDRWCSSHLQAYHADTDLL